MGNGNNTREFVDYIVPPKKVWIRILDPEDAKKPRKDPIKVSGTDGNLTYVGYQTIGTMTILVFDRFAGSGRKTSVERFSVNAASILYMDLMEPRE
jgi:hypothetical protein